MLASLLSLTLGLVMVTLMQPGVGLSSPCLTTPPAPAWLPAPSPSRFRHPRHPQKRDRGDGHQRDPADRGVLLFFGLAAAALGDAAKPVVMLMASAAEIMLKVTGYVMNFAPFAVFGAIAAMVAKEGLGILATYGTFMAQFYLALGCLWLLLIAMGSLFIRRRIVTLLAMIREPILLAFSTASSKLPTPRPWIVWKFGCDKRIASFVLPMGYSFNLDGSMMYCTFAVMFIAQAYGIELSMAQQITMLLLMITSRGWPAYRAPPWW